VDLPGCNHSDRLADAGRERVGDLIARLLRQVVPGRRASLVGHDMGGLIAWDVAARYPELVDRLVVINAPPAAVLARELERRAEQRRASAYVDALRAPGAEVALAARGFERLCAQVYGTARSPDVFGPDERKAYAAAWSRPGSLAGSVQYYRAWKPDPTPAPKVRAPTLVLWGERDPFLLSGCLEGLEAHAHEVQVERVPGATHWLVHEEPRLVTEALRAFLVKRPEPLSFREPVFDVLRERELWRQHPDYSCFWSGPDNPRGLRLTPRIEPGRVSVRTTIGRDHSGVVGLAHGGIVFTVLDGVMGWLIMSHLGRLGLTRQAHVEYLAPVHVGQEVEFEAVPDPEVPVTAQHVSVLARAYPVGAPDRPCARVRAQFFLPDRSKAEAVLGRTLEGVSANLFP
jgi:pimeloyl-ACP methyl ester carboxylesterase/acyl-coenzyme A thioesterase PaaI-like protein